MKKFFNRVLDFLVPPNIKCIFCGGEIENPNKYNACKACLEKLPYNTGKVCRLCGNKIYDESEICLSCYHTPPPFHGARAPFSYDVPIAGMIKSLKFDSAKYLVEPLGNFMADTLEETGWKIDFIVPVPLSAKRMKQRSYNQAAELAKVVAKRAGLEVREGALERVRDTFPQARLLWKARQKNVEGAFGVVDKKAIRGKSILVVDDVMTSGATIKSLCREILKAKPKKIYVLTLARTSIDRIKIKNRTLWGTLRAKLRVWAKKTNGKLSARRNKKA